MMDYRPSPTPLVTNEHLLPATSNEITKLKSLKINFRSAVGSINYLSSATQPDLSFAVSTLSQYLEYPGIRHWHAFLHVLFYLKGTQDLGLNYPANLPKGIVAWSHANWGNFRATSRSVTGFLATFSGRRGNSPQYPPPWKKPGTRHSAISTQNCYGLSSGVKKQGCLYQQNPSLCGTTTKAVSKPLTVTAISITNK
ncbi:hypothetical protein O181_076884 [Austropuccinia psidii MF-1]|uniref:Reverse transcriptase Ty1/copia-type domain-containing protein n=1 Tax=Austropuccinia psidii MF-1 TaxID=1389203 RepID=A0A9Q3FDX1_9BASI|nr:hypothetical protein [Austropuccinia psidii MF-1]